MPAKKKPSLSISGNAINGSIPPHFYDLLSVNSRESSENEELTLPNDVLENDHSAYFANPRSGASSHKLSPTAEPYIPTQNSPNTFKLRATAQEFKPATPTRFVLRPLRRGR